MTVDPKTFRLAVAFLGLALLGCIAGICTLAALKTAIPDSLTTVAGVVGGALAGLFATPHTDTPQPVTVTNQPVSVTDAPPRKTSRRRARGDAGLTALGVIVLVIVVFLLAGVLGTTVHPLFFLLLLLLVLAVVL